MDAVFIYLEEFQVLIYKEHEHAVTKERLERHLWVEHQGITLQERRHILEVCQELTIAGLGEVKYLKSAITALAHLQKPIKAF